MKLKHVFSIALIHALLLFSFSICSEPAKIEDKPFAEHQVVLQISDMAPAKQTLVLNVATNLIKHFGSDKIEIEIVAFGPGLRLLLADNANKGRVSGLVDSGVRFAACDNTMSKFTSVLGHEPSLHKGAFRVNAGVVRILELTAKDYQLIKP